MIYALRERLRPCGAERTKYPEVKATFEDILKKDGKLVYKTRGVSMKPMLIQDRDLVIVEVPKGRLKPYDIALYKRREQYVLHRVISVKEDHYLIRGDNTYSVEKVTFDHVIGVLTAFVHNGREIRVTDRTFRVYSYLWNGMYPLRHILVKGKRVSRRMIRNLVNHE
jgi:hypothetical protein